MASPILLYLHISPHGSPRYTQPPPRVKTTGAVTSYPSPYAHLLALSPCSSPRARQSATLAPHGARAPVRLRPLLGASLPGSRHARRELSAPRDALLLRAACD